MRKLLFLFIAPFFSLQAEPTYYAGFLAGYQHFSSDIYHEIDIQRKVGSVVKKVSLNLSAEGTANLFQGGLLGGIDFSLAKRWSAGIQLLAETNTGALKRSAQTIYYDDQRKERDLTISYVLRQYFLITPAVRLTYHLTPQWRQFVTWGVGMSLFELKTTDPVAINNKQFNFRVGFIPSFGGEYDITPNISLIATVHYNLYNSTNVHFDTKRYGYAEIHNITLYPQSFTLKLGALIRF